MSYKQIIFLIIIFLISFGALIRLVIHNKLREGFAVIWFMMVLSIPIAILIFPLLSNFIKILGIYDSVNFMFFIAIIVLSMLLLHFSILSSTIQHCLKNAIQKIAILEQEIKSIKKNKLEEFKNEKSIL